jgi:predicted dehydrogenase
MIALTKGDTMDKICRVGIIGCGGIARMHADMYKAYDRTEIVTLADISEEHLKKFASDYNVSKIYTDYIQMLETEKPDIVSVCTWPGTHSQITIDAAKRGIKGVLCEKPMGLNLEQADAMIKACEENNTKLAIDHQLRFSGEYVAAKNLLIAGAIGQLFRIHAVCGGGDLKDNATHTVDLMRFIHGDKPIEWVIGQIERTSDLKRYGMDSEQFALGYMKFADNVRGVIEVGDDTAPGYHHIYLYGTEGEIELGAPGGPAIRMRTKASGGDWTMPETKYDSDPVRDLVACIEENRLHRSSGYQGRATHEVLMAIYESSRRRKRVRLPLEEKESPLTLMIKEGLL